MLKKTEEKYFHIYAPYEGCKSEEGEYLYTVPTRLENNTFLFTAPIRIMISGKLQSCRVVTKAVKNNSGVMINTLNGFIVGPRTFTSVAEVQYVLDVMEGKKQRKETEKVPMIVPKPYGSGGKKSYPMSDVLEVTKDHYIMKNGRALKRRNYIETQAEKDHPELLLKMDGTVVQESRWNPAKFKDDKEKAECIKVLKYVKEVMDTHNTVEIEQESKAMDLMAL